MSSTHRKDKDNCFSKIKKQLNYLREIPPEIQPHSDDVSYGYHTLIKLMFLNYYMGFFLPIAKNNAEGKVIFVDAFGGSGLVKIKNTNTYVKGSSLCAALANYSRSNKPRFDEVYSFEIDRSRYNLLKARFEALSRKVTPKLYAINEDVNNAINKIQINEGDFVLLFIDPEGLEPQMINFLIFALQSEHVDIILNISSGIRRVEGMAKINPAYEKKLREFLPNYRSGMSIENSIDELFTKYFQKMYEVSTQVTSAGKKEVYTLTLRVRKTKGGAPFIPRFKEFTECLKNLSGEDIKNILKTPRSIENWGNVSGKN